MTCQKDRKIAHMIKSDALWDIGETPPDFEI